MIFHCYVSSPEGNANIFMGFLLMGSMAQHFFRSTVNGSVMGNVCSNTHWWSLFSISCRSNKSVDRAAQEKRALGNPNFNPLEVSPESRCGHEIIEIVYHFGKELLGSLPNLRKSRKRQILTDSVPMLFILGRFVCLKFNIAIENGDL